MKNSVLFYGKFPVSISVSYSFLQLKLVDGEMCIIMLILAAFLYVLVVCRVSPGKSDNSDLFDPVFNKYHYKRGKSMSK